VTTRDSSLPDISCRYHLAGSTRLERHGALCFLLGLTAIAAAACARRVSEQPLPREPLATANTMCFRSLTVGPRSFGDTTVQSHADTSYLLVHGLRDTLVADTAGPAWLSLAQQGWFFSRARWHRLSYDSLLVTFEARGASYEYRLVLYEAAARGFGTEVLRSPGIPMDTTISHWNMSLRRWHCSGLRDPPPVPPNNPVDRREGVP